MIARAVVAAFAVAATVSVGAGLGLPASASAPPSIGLRLVDVPRSAGNDPRALIYIVDHVAPGTIFRRRIELSNSAATARIDLYPAGATIAGGRFLGVAGHTPNDLSTWTSVDPRSSVVAAGARLTATVTIAVPADAAPGEQYGVVWAETRSAPTPGGVVTQVSRVGLRIYLSVGPGGPPAANFTIRSLTAERASDGQPLVVATVHNTGGRALDMSGTLQLSGGPGGLSAGPFPATLGTTLAIDDTEAVTVALDDRLPAGPWNARIALRSGLIERRARATITFPRTGSSPPVNTTSSRTGVPFVVVAGLVVFLTGGAALSVLLRKRPRRAF